MMRTEVVRTGEPASGDDGVRAPGGSARRSPYERFCHSVVLPAADLALRQRVRATFDELLAFQWAAPDEIDRFRNRRLGELIRVSAERVPFYRSVFRERGLRPGDIQTPYDLPRLPVLTKQHLRDHFEALRDEAHRGPTYAAKSSGSTGTQTTVLLDRACNDEVFATQLLFWSWGGFSMGRPHLQTGIALERGITKTLKDLVFRCSYFSAFELEDAALAAMVRQIDRRGIRTLFGYASSHYLLARYLDARGERRRMDSMFSWGDSLFPHYRDLIERTFECKVNDCYGLGEGLQCAAQCEEHDGLHEAMHGVIIEIVNHDGMAVPAGQLGRVVVTRLVPGPMPLIRYDTGDIAHVVDGPCPCGRALRRLSRVQGRSTDIVTTPAGDRLIVHVFTQIFQAIPQIAQFQIRQDRPEAIRVLYVGGRGFEPGVLEHVRAEILSHCRYPLEITFECVDDVPVERSNKRRFVISSVPF